MYGGEDEIRTHATVARPNAFRVRPLITTWVLLRFGASDGNRTRAASLGSWSSTIELHLNFSYNNKNYTTIF